MANISIFDIVISKLGYWQKYYLIILFKINKSLKIFFCFAIVCLFCLFNGR